MILLRGKVGHCRHLQHPSREAGVLSFCAAYIGHRLGYSTSMKYITIAFIFTCTCLLIGCDAGPMDGEPAAFQQESGAAYTQQQLEQTEEPDDPTFMLPDQ